MFDVTKFCFFVSSFGLIFARLDNNSAPRIKITVGNVKGYHKISESGRQYQAYEGIPYALPPIGKRRFKAPEPVKGWLGELQATKQAHECLQYVQNPPYLKKEQLEEVTGSEDCLYLNVYVSENKNNSTMPVIIFFHGGGFTYGSGNLLGAKFIMDKNIILVIVNYRLGPLGFLSTEDNVVPGNMGLKDQSLAIHWVHDNIEYFGGDPQRVTLAGLSAGGASVHYHYFSPMSSGLFQNGIAISGTVLNCWVQTENSLEKAKKLGSLLGCPTKSNKEMIKCLRQRPSRSVVQAVKNFMPWLYNPFTPFGPVVEKSGEKSFIDRQPIQMLETGDVLDVPFLTSVTSEEGLYPTADFVADKKLLKELNENWEAYAPHLLDFNYTIPLNLQPEISKKIRQYYMKNTSINKKNIKPLIKMVGDRLFVVDAEKAARMQAKSNKSPVWFYYYTYKATSSLSNTFTGTKENFGVSHGDDALMVFESKFFNPIATERDQAMQKDIINMWISFAYENKLDLYPMWKKVDPLDDNFTVFKISGPDTYEMTIKENFGNKQFWNTINFNENLLKNFNFKDEL